MKTSKSCRRKSVIALLGDHQVAYPIVLIGPVVWGMRSSGSRYWYFIVCVGTVFGFRVTPISGETEESVSHYRTTLRNRLARANPSFVADLADELEMAIFIEAIWPSQDATTLRRILERRENRYPPS